MPYVPSLKTDGKSKDRILIDDAVEALVKKMSGSITSNFSVLEQYKRTFSEIASSLIMLVQCQGFKDSNSELANVIFNVGSSYGYDGAFLGGLNYAITRVIQRLPQFMVASKKWTAKDELRYWLYAITVEALTVTSSDFQHSGVGVGGVFEDIKDEYKRRVNSSYEAAQIMKSGDCYDTPYYNRLVRVVNEDGKEIGKILVDMARSEETLHKDIMDGEIVMYEVGRFSD